MRWGVHDLLAFGDGAVLRWKALACINPVGRRRTPHRWWLFPRSIPPVRVRALWSVGRLVIAYWNITSPTMKAINSNTSNAPMM
jgi:hypothetical protein